MASPPTEREKLLAKVFYHPQTGFGSVEHTLKTARLQDAGITREHVRSFIAKQEIRQRRKPLKVNSFVADLPRQEFQVDLLDMGERSSPRYGFVAYDIFTKKGACIPITSKVATETTEALRKVFDELGYPVSIMCDEGGEFQGEFAKECKNEQVEIIRSRTGGRFVERFIRTLKMPLYERLKSLGGNWTHYIQPVVDKYNDSVHSATRYKPDDLTEHEYDMPMQEKAYQNQLSKAKFPVKHDSINNGDLVKIRVKPSGFGDHKETFNSWSKEVYTVERVASGAQDGQDVYHLTGYRRPLLRFELKKIEGVQRYKNGELVSALHEVKHPRPASVRPSQEPIPRPPVPVFRPATRSTTAGGSSGSGQSVPNLLPMPRSSAIHVPIIPPSRAVAPGLVAAASAPIVRRPMTRSQTRS